MNGEISYTSRINENFVHTLPVEIMKGLSSRSATGRSTVDGPGQQATPVNVSPQKKKTLVHWPSFPR